MKKEEGAQNDRGLKIIMKDNAKEKKKIKRIK